MAKREESFAEVRGGMLGKASVFIVFFLAICVLSLLGIRGAKSFWSAGVLAIAVSFFVFKDKDVFQEAVKNGIKNDVFVMTMLAFFFAGILAKMLTAGHLVDSLIWLASQVNMPSELLPLLTFIVCSIVSTATGTSSGTVATVAPILLPLAFAMGCKTELMCGAMVSGAYFGDNLALISDTTIASALTQEVSMLKVVRSRIKYSVVCAIIAAILFWIMGTRTTTQATDAMMQGDPAFAKNLVFLVLPILVVVLMVRGSNLLTSLLLADILGGVMLLAMGIVDLPGMVSGAGIIASGIDGMAGATTLIMFAFIVASIAHATGFLDSVVQRVKSRAKTPRSAEIISGLFTELLVFVTGSPSASIVIAGPMARQLLRPFRIDRARCANILDGLGCGTGGLMPHCSTVAMMATLVISTGVTTNPNFSTFDFFIYNYHCLALIAVFWFAILSGWGRRFETDAEVEMDQTPQTVGA